MLLFVSLLFCSQFGSFESTYAYIRFDLGITRNRLRSAKRFVVVAAADTINVQTQLNRYF